MAKGYTTRQNIENYLLITIDPTFHAQVETWIEEIEAYIDQQTGRNFKADAVASARYFDGDNTPTLLIDDAVAITEVVLDSVNSPTIVELPADYVTYPANRLPKTKITMRGSYFPRGPLQAIKITGKWGFSVNVPADIVQAATVLTAGIINYSLNADGEVQTMSIGSYSVTYKAEKQWQDFDRIKGILDSYKKFTF